MTIYKFILVINPNDYIFSFIKQKHALLYYIHLSRAISNVRKQVFVHQISYLSNGPVGWSVTAQWAGGGAGVARDMSVA